MIVYNNITTHILNCLNKCLDSFGSDKITVIYYLIFKLLPFVLEDNKILSLFLETRKL